MSSIPNGAEDALTGLADRFDGNSSASRNADPKTDTAPPE
jgi:hypothetical protein